MRKVPPRAPQQPPPGRGLQASVRGAPAPYQAKRSARPDVYRAPSYFSSGRDEFDDPYDRAMSSLGDIRHAQLSEKDENRSDRNGFAVAGLVLGALLDPFFLGFVFSGIGLRRAGSSKRGKAIAWTGIALSTIWLVLSVGYVVPKLTGKTAPTVATHGGGRADAGCVAVDAFMSGPIGSKDLGSDDDAKSLESDLQAMVTGLQNSASKSKEPQVKAAIGKLATDFKTMLDAMKAGEQPPEDFDATITSDGDALDKACGITDG